MNAPTQTAPHAPSNIPVHITFGFLFFYLAITRYLLYFSPLAASHDYIPARALGASIGYFFTWAMGYWLCATSPRKALVTWIAGLGVFLGPLIFPLVGYVLLIVVAVIRHRQRKHLANTSLATG